MRYKVSAPPDHRPEGRHAREYRNPQGETGRTPPGLRLLWDATERGSSGPTKGWLESPVLWPQGRPRNPRPLLVGERDHSLPQALYRSRGLPDPSLAPTHTDTDLGVFDRHRRIICPSC